MQDPKSCALPTWLRPNTPNYAQPNQLANQVLIILLHLSVECLQHLILNMLTQIHRNRMDNILKTPVGPLPAGHGDKKTLLSVDYFQSANHEGIVESNIGEGLQLRLIPKRNADFCDLHPCQPPLCLAFSLPSR